MRRSGPLARRTPLRNGAWLRRADPGQARPRDTGPSRRTRALVLRRDGWRCVACYADISDGRPYSLQHRLARGQGGSGEPCNLITLCGSATSPGGCHARAESRDPHMHAAGYYLESWQDPAAEPVMICGPQGGITVWLSADGTYLIERAA